MDEASLGVSPHHLSKPISLGTMGLGGHDDPLHDHVVVDDELAVAVREVRPFLGGLGGVLPGEAFAVARRAFDVLALHCN